MRGFLSYPQIQIPTINLYSYCKFQLTLNNWRNETPISACYIISYTLAALIFKDMIGCFEFDGKPNEGDGFLAGVQGPQGRYEEDIWS